MTDEQRLERGLRWCSELFGMTFHLLEQENPCAPRYEIVALWNERMYRGKVPDTLLDAAMAEIRRLGALGLPAHQP